VKLFVMLLLIVTAMGLLSLTSNSIGPTEAIKRLWRPPIDASTIAVASPSPPASVTTTA
jgi:hypothetical protein